jgi:DNA-binding protein YbaB
LREFEEICKRLREFEEKYKSQGKAVEVTVNSKENFVWISSKNSASDLSSSQEDS